MGVAGAIPPKWLKHYLGYEPRFCSLYSFCRNADLLRCTDPYYIYCTKYLKRLWCPLKAVCKNSMDHPRCAYPYYLTCSIYQKFRVNNDG